MPTLIFFLFLLVLPAAGINPLLYIGPYVHTWYEQLWKIGRWMEDKFESPKRTQTIVQLLVDQTVGIAIFFSTYFYVYEIIDALVSRRSKRHAVDCDLIFGSIPTLVPYIPCISKFYIS